VHREKYFLYNVDLIGVIVRSRTDNEGYLFDPNRPDISHRRISVPKGSVGRLSGEIAVLLEATEDVAPYLGLAVNRRQLVELLSSDDAFRAFNNSRGKSPETNAERARLIRLEVRWQNEPNNSAPPKNCYMLIPWLELAT